MFIVRGQPRALRRGEVFRISGRSFGKNFGFPYLNFSLSPKQGEVKQFWETFFSRPQGWALITVNFIHVFSAIYDLAILHPLQQNFSYTKMMEEYSLGSERALHPAHFKSATYYKKRGPLNTCQRDTSYLATEE